MSPELANAIAVLFIGGIAAIGAAGGVVGGVIGQKIASSSLDEVKTRIPTVTSSNKCPSVSQIIDRWSNWNNKSNMAIQSLNRQETVIWLHLNKGKTINENSIVLTDYRLLKIEGGAVISTIPLHEIDSMQHQKNGLLHWDKLIATSSCGRVETFGINHPRIVDGLIDTVSELQRRGLIRYHLPSDQPL
jgi:hypothetical protein